MTLRRWLAVAAVVGLVGGQVAWGAATGAELRRDAGLTVLSPADGARVTNPFVLAWRPQHGVSAYAILIDHNPPRTSKALAAGPSTVIVRGMTMTPLSISDRERSSPSLRRFHVITIVPLDAAGHRRGEDIASVHVLVRRG